MTRFFLVCLAGLAVVVPGRGAEGSATVTGLIREPDGRAAGLARVTLVDVVHVDRAPQVVVADAAGIYRVADVTPGRYRIFAHSVESRASAISLVSITPGESLEFPLLLAFEGTSAVVHEPARVPLSTGNYLDLLSNLSEITRGEAGGNIDGFGPWSTRGNMSFNSTGLRGQNNNFTIDGFDNNEPWLGGTVLNPGEATIEAVSLTAPYLPASIGHAAGGSVEVTTRSGTPQFHASLFTSVSNSAFGARNFFDGAQKPLTDSNHPGFNLSGPVKHSDWVFFLAGEFDRDRNGLTVISTVPTMAMRGGTFAEPIYNPLSVTQVSPTNFVRDPFANNEIPQSLIAPQGTALMNLYPDPNLPGAANNFRYNPTDRQNGERYTGRTDKKLSERGRIFGRINYEQQGDRSPGALPNAAGSDVVQHADNADVSISALGLAAGYTFMLKPTLANELRAGYTAFRFDGSPADVGLNASAVTLIPGLNIPGSTGGLPVVSPEGYAQLGASQGLPGYQHSRSIQLNDTVRWTTSRHVLEFGASLVRRHLTGDTSEWTSRGTFLFTPDYTGQQGVSNTGNPIASMLTGYPSEVRRDVQFQPYDLAAWELAGFVQDTLRLWRKLSLEAGIRYSLDPPVTEANARMVNFDFDRSDPALNQFAGQAGVSSYDNVQFRKTTVAPRIGFVLAFDDKGHTILRGGFSQGYDPGTYMAEGALARNPPYASNLDLYNGTIQVGPALGNGLPAPVSTDLLNATALNASQNAIYAIEPHAYTPYADQWGLTLERHLIGNWVGELSGSGSMGIHLEESYDINEPYPAPTPYAYPRYPYQPLQTRVEYLGFAGGSTYYGGQAKVAGDIRHQLHVTATYRRAKSIDDSTQPDTFQLSRPSTPQYIYDLRGMRSVSPFDIPQRLVVNASWTIPAESGSQTAWYRAATAGWRVSTLVVAQSGLPFTPQMATNNLNNGGIQLPDRIGDGALAANRQSVSQWFNTSLNPALPGTAFVEPALFQYGSSGFDILRGPGLATVDAGLDRTFALREKMRLDLQFEFFNILNRVNLGLPQRLLGLESSGTISYTATPARRGQIVARLEW